MKVLTALGQLSLLALTLAMGVGFLPTATDPQQSKIKEPEVVAPEEVRLFRLKHVQPDTMITLLKQLRPNARDLKLTSSGGSLAAVGSTEALAALQKIIDALDVEAASEGDRDGWEFQVLPVHSADADLESALRMILGVEGPFVVDRQRNLVIFSGRRRSVEAVKKLLDVTQGAASKKPASRQLQVRVIWLASGLQREEKGQSGKEFSKPPADLKDVVSELSRIGITEPVVVAQTMANVIENRDFTIRGQVNNAFSFGAHLETEGIAKSTADESTTLHLKVKVRHANVEQGNELLCNIDSTVMSPLGHFTVLGMTPTQLFTSIFVVQVQARK